MLSIIIICDTYFILMLGSVEDDVTAYGWGAKVFKGNSSDILQELKFQIWRNQDWDIAYRHLQDSNIVAMGYRGDVCQGEIQKV